jgi:hypothetical protein
MKNKMGKGALMMNQNANEILSAGAKPPLAGERVWPGAESDWRGQHGFLKGAGELPYETA